MKTRHLLFAAAVIPMLAVSCKEKKEQGACQECVNRENIIVDVPRGEQAPPANPGQRNFGGMIPQGGTANRQRQQRPAQSAQSAQPAQRPPQNMQRPTPQVRTVSIKELSMSDPFIYPVPDT